MSTTPYDRTGISNKIEKIKRNNSFHMERFIQLPGIPGVVKCHAERGTYVSVKVGGHFSIFRLEADTGSSVPVQLQADDFESGVFSFFKDKLVCVERNRINLYDIDGCFQETILNYRAKQYGETEYSDALDGVIMVNSLENSLELMTLGGDLSTLFDGGQTGQTGQTVDSTAVAERPVLVSRMTFFKNLIYLVGWHSKKIRILNHQGKLEKQVELPVTCHGWSGIEVSDDGYIFLVNLLQGKVLKMSSSGEMVFWGELHREGTAPGFIRKKHEPGQYFICDRKNKGVWVVVT